MNGTGPGPRSWGKWPRLVTVFGWMVNTAALLTRAFERLEHSGTFAPWSNQFEAMAYVSWAIILGYVLLELRYKIKAIGAFVVGIGFVAMGRLLLPYRYQTAELSCQRSIVIGSTFTSP